jgi:hypothetical protein
MKTLYTVIAGFTLLVGISASAQTALTTDIQSQIASDESLPVLGVRYYYYPNLDAYFDSEENLYLYEQGGQYVKAKEIPSGYRGYSLYNKVRVAITDYDGDKPYTKLDEHRKQFPKKYSSRRQPPKSDHKLAFN